MTTDLRVILCRPWLAKIFINLVPAGLFHRLNEFFTRYWSRNLSRTFLADQYDKAHERVMNSLEMLEEDDFQTSLKYPEFDPLLSGVVTVERLYRYMKLHFEVHAGQIRERLGGILV
jgi:hypothetical protein